MSTTTGFSYHIRDAASPLHGFIITRLGVNGTTNFNNANFGVNGLGEVTYANVVVDTWELYDGNGWGDNNKFEITDNRATQTDDNGNTVKYGTASFNTQYFITEE